jgi:hypothetical protein
MWKSRGFNKASTALLVLLFAAGLLIGGLVTFYISFQEINIMSITSPEEDLKAIMK